MDNSISVENDAFLQACLSFLRFLMKYHRYEVVGMDHIPKTGPALIVINHSLATYKANSWMVLLLRGLVQFSIAGSCYRCMSCGSTSGCS